MKSPIRFAFHFLKRGDIRSTLNMLTIMRCLCLFRLRMTVLHMNLYLLALTGSDNCWRS